MLPTLHMTSYSNVHLRGHSKITSLLKSLFLTPLPPLSHFVIFCLDPPPPHVTHQKVTNSDLENQWKIIFPTRWFGPIFYLIFIKNRCSNTKIEWNYVFDRLSKNKKMKNCKWNFWDEWRHFFDWPPSPLVTLSHLFAQPPSPPRRVTSFLNGP